MCRTTGRSVTRLTLNIGLRYDVDVPRTERYNRLSYFDIDAPSPIAGKVPGFREPERCDAFRDAGQSPPDPHRSEQLGSALRLRLSSSLRSPCSAAHTRSCIRGSVMQAAGTSGSSGTEGFTSSTNMIISNDGGRTIAASLNNPYPERLQPAARRTEGPFSGANTNLGLGIGASFFNDYRNPVIQQWNVPVSSRNSAAGS